MEEIEVPTEHLHEEINEQAQHERSNWSFYVAISTALMAVMAAVASLLAGHHSNEAVIDQIRASDQWAYYQAKGIKAEIAGMLSKDTVKTAKYAREQHAIQENAREHEQSSARHLAMHVFLARAVTLFQIAIAISAVSIISKKKALWFTALVFVAAGIVCFCQSFL